MSEKSLDRPSIAEIAALTRRLRELTRPGRGGDPAERDRFMADKRALVDRITAADEAATGRYVNIACPECGDDVEDMPPEDWLVPGEVPGYRHVADRTPLCPVKTREGDRPAEPIEQPSHTATTRERARAAEAERRAQLGAWHAEESTHPDIDADVLDLGGLGHEDGATP